VLYSGKWMKHIKSVCCVGRRCSWLWLWLSLVWNMKMLWNLFES